MAPPKVISETEACVALVARSILDSDFLDRLSFEPDRAMAEMDIPDWLRPQLESLDTSRVALISGFICRVKHNDLWENLPLTRQILRERGVELEVFTAYARAPRQVAHRVGAFVHFLKNNFEVLGLTGNAIADIAQHELLIDQLRSATLDLPGTDSPSADHGSWRPRHRGAVAIGSFRHDPAEFTARAESGVAIGEGLVSSDEPIFVCYSRSGPERNIRMFRIDPATALVLTAANGTNSVDEIATRCGITMENASIVEEILAAAVERDLIEARAIPRPSLESSEDPVLGLLEGYFATRVLYIMHRNGVLARLNMPMSSKRLAEALDLNAEWLENALEFLALNTAVVERLPDRRFQAAPMTYEQLGFALDKFVGAYGPCLEHDEPSGDAVDGLALAQAFERVTSERSAESPDRSVIVTLLKDWGVAADVIDLGCGSGGVLVELAEHDRAFRGVGVDQNGAMCAAARRAVAKRQLGRQVEIREGDAISELQLLSAGRLRAVTAIHGRSFLNACFRCGPGQAATVVKALGRLCAGRLLFVDDYYGELGRQSGSSATCRWAVLQDLVQSWSGQGVPPGTRAEWAQMYALGDARLLHSYEDEVDGFRRFIHVVRLGAE